MSLEIAKKAIDDLKQRSKNQDLVNVGFYGGEPLLRFPLIKECISYAQEVIDDKELVFAMIDKIKNKFEVRYKDGNIWHPIH